MKVAIQDNEVLKTINPAKVVTYLKSNGWQQEIIDNDRVSVFIQRIDSGKELVIELPLKPEFRDFSRRMSEVIKTLEDAEQRSQLEIFTDIRTSWADVIRLRVHHPNLVDGSIPLEDSIRIQEYALNMILSAASSTIKPQTYFQEKMAKAVDYTRQLRIGQTEESNAYILTIISPLSIDKTHSNGEISPILPEPFERQVLKQLVSALETSRIAAENVASTGSLDAFIGTEQNGISANFCEAMVGINENSGNSGVEIALSWSPLLAMLDNVPDKVILPANYMPIIKQIGENFRANWQKEFGGKQAAVNSH